MARDYKNIKAWQEAKKFVLSVYSNTQDFPKEEIYGITSQIRRASVSVCSNIAEGASRQHKRDYLNFLFIARASLAEAESLLMISHELKFLTLSKYERLSQLCQETAKVLYGLIQVVESEL